MHCKPCALGRAYRRRAAGRRRGGKTRRQQRASADASGDSYAPGLQRSYDEYPLARHACIVEACGSAAGTSIALVLSEPLANGQPPTRVAGTYTEIQRPSRRPGRGRANSCSTGLRIFLFEKIGAHRRVAARALCARRLLRLAGNRQVAARETGVRATRPLDKRRRHPLQSAAVQVRGRRPRLFRSRRAATAGLQIPAGRFRATQPDRSRLDFRRSAPRGPGAALCP
jgi:hypothetical protein